MKTDKTGRQLNELFNSLEQNNLLLGSIVLLLEEIKEGHEGKFFVWLKKHKWTTVFSVFFGLTSLFVSVAQVFLVLAGLYYYPEETRALIQTILTMLGVR